MFQDFRSCLKLCKKRVEWIMFRDFRSFLKLCSCLTEI